MTAAWPSLFRITVGLYWLYFASTKWLGVGWVQPLLQSAGGTNPIPGLRELLTNLVAPNWFIFAVGQTVGETVVAVLLILGLATRWAGILGLLLATGLALTVGFEVKDDGFRWLYQLLRCPRCGTAPESGLARCNGCCRSIAAAGGGLDLLDDGARAAADRFAAQYTALRRREGWIGADGREDPEGGEPRLWRGRLESASRAEVALSSHRTGVERAVVVDVGSGGGWAARYLRDADIIAIDLL